MKSHFVYLIANIVLTTNFANSSVAATPNPDSAAMDSAPIVFTGVVKNTASVSFDGVPKSDHTIVVEVAKVLRPSGVDLYPGATVTMSVIDPPSLVEGSRVTFYAHAWILGKGIALREIGHTNPQHAQPATEKSESVDFAGTHLIATRSKLMSMIDHADSVIEGRVVAVRESKGDRPTGEGEYVSEHDPYWKEAVVKVDSKLKGASPTGQVIVRFPSSEDIRWVNAPKFSEGEEGTFLLFKDRNSSSTSAAQTGAARAVKYTAVNMDDMVTDPQLQQFVKEYSAVKFGVKK